MREDPSKAAPATVPRPIAGVDLRKLPIGPVEAFILSRVDGTSTEVEISLSTGVPPEDVNRALARLSELGAVDLGAGTTTPPVSAPRERPQAAGDRTSGTHAKAPPTAEAEPRPAAARAKRAPYPPEELEEAADLDLERKQRILELFHRLGTANHYQLLGVSEKAEKKDLRAAYFELVSVFHPDKYFGKSLGSFKAKIEEIFKRLTDAHDTLSKKKTREEYDRYLESQRATRALDTPDAAAAVEEILREMEQEARSIAPAPPQPEPPPQPENPPAAPAGPRLAPSTPDLSKARPMTAEERRRTLARKLSGRMPQPRASEANRPAVAPKEVAAEVLKQHYEQRLKQLQAERVARYVAQADEALKAKNPVAAVNALRIAVSIAPDDLELGARFARVEREASVTLAERYLDQAKYEERRGEFAAAAQAYERATKGRPTAQLFERAAFCLIEARSEPRKAVDLSRRAVELAPGETAYRITLARAYARAGMEQSALGELERAREKSPGDDTIKDWLKRLKRGEI